MKVQLHLESISVEEIQGFYHFVYLSVKALCINASKYQPTSVQM
jgi:hypothetical protein